MLPDFETEDIVNTKEKEAKGKKGEKGEKHVILVFGINSSKTEVPAVPDNVVIHPVRNPTVVGDGLDVLSLVNLAMNWRSHSGTPQEKATKLVERRVQRLKVEALSLCDTVFHTLERVLALEAKEEDEVYIVGHSHGGWAVCCLLELLNALHVKRQTPELDVRNRISGVVIMGSPVEPHTSVMQCKEMEGKITILKNEGDVIPMMLEKLQHETLTAMVAAFDMKSHGLESYFPQALQQMDVEVRKPVHFLEVVDALFTCLVLGHSHLSPVSAVSNVLES